ncbi:MAG: hypothetical protein KME54_22440 [Tolypothrix brevis GSE-NOS-MK-07-07A]|jgi:hypothetical protein|nr:hypothetical protein [Tolypothrix brevis GSE-NOS-MK-07-07A]
MKQTTVYLPEEIDNSLNSIAQMTGLIQEAIQKYLLRTNQPLPQCVGMGASGMRNLSERDEDGID